MSLHTLANHLQSAGRGEDKVLVHMTPGEVKGLQSLAMAQGGSLTINPETGLPEAGILSSLLPMIAGFALGPAGLGLTAMQAGLASAAIGTVATGSLKQGVMAGLGAYGGAGLGQGLMAQGTAAVPTTTPAVSASVPTPVQSTAGDIFAQGGRFGNVGAVDIAANPLQGGMTGFQAGIPSVSPTAPGLTSTTFTPAQGAVPTTAPTVNTAIDPNAYVKPTIYPDVSSMPPGGSYAQLGPGRYTVSGPGGFPVDAPAATSSANVPIETRVPTPVERGVVRSEVYPGAPDPSVPVRTYTGAVSDRMAQLGQGAKTSFSSTEGLKGLYNAMPEYSVLASGATLANAMKPEYKEPKKDKSLIRPYEFTYGATGADREPYTGSAERLYFNPQFTALTPYEAPGPEYKRAAEGGLMGFAVGGQVEQMAAMNAVGANTGYPMANLQTPMYSNPMMQRPEATNVIAPSADAGVGTYTGEARFASGGHTAEPQTTGGYSYSYDPTTMQFTQTGAPQPVNTGRAGSSSPLRSITNPNGGPAFMGPVGSGYYGAGSYSENARLPGKSATTTATSKNNVVTGGIAQPAMQPAAPAQSLIPNINIPEYQTPEQQLGLGGFYNTMDQQLGGMSGYAGYAAGGNVGGISHLGDYSDGGRLLKGPGDGVSDSIPASIGDRQPARLADGEFVVPARIVSEIGNGSTEAGARKLYAMMDRVQKARRSTVGKGQVARNTKAEKLLPA